MWKSSVLLLCLSGYCLAGPVGTKRNMPIVQLRDEESLVENEPAAVAEPELTIMSTLTLPSNATSIRADITDGFSCENKTYGYYADVDNDCQIFHVCLPVTYADGKENTFRWSFICPEETIFSQDSFTCMRPDDMAITCDDSFQYYELNRNFGMVDSNRDNESENSEPNETQVQAAETQPEPVVQEEEEEEESKLAAKPVQQPIKVQKPNRRKPAVSYASQKKPNNSVPLRKMPQVQPIIPEINDNPDAEDKNAIEKPVQVEEKDKEQKPLVQKFSRRPVPTVTNALKDKIESSKPESMTGIRTQLFNQNRKRPSMFNKKPIDQQQDLSPEMKPIPVESQPEEQTFFHLESEMSNNNAETQVADSEHQASENNQVFVKPEQPQEIVETSIIKEDSNKVDNEKTVDIPNENVIIKEPQPVLEAFEEIPAVIAEVLETQSGAKVEEEPKIEAELPNMITEETQTAQESQNTEELQNAEKSQTAEESQNFEESQNTEQSQNAEKTENYENPQKQNEDTQTAEGSETPQESQTGNEKPAVEESQKAEETPVAEENSVVEETKLAEETKEEEAQNVAETVASEEIQISDNNEEPQPIDKVHFVDNFKPETLFVEEPQPIEADLPMEDIQTPEETQTVEEIPMEVQAQPEQPELYPASEELGQTHSVAEPAIFENSEEGVAVAPSQTIEEMEEEKPADAPESMQATEEMSHPAPNVQQMMEDLEDNKHSIGGFKPVDPVIAHEAEQLIADFINTLRNNDFTNETPGMIRHQYNSVVPEKEQEQPQDNVAVNKEADKIGNSETIQENAAELLDKTDIIKESEKSNEEVEAETQPEVNVIEAIAPENNAAEMEDTKEDVPTLSQENIAEEMENIKEELETLSQENNVEEMEYNKEETAEDQPETVAVENADNQESIALKSLEAQSSENVEESSKSGEQQGESSNLMVVNNMPEEMYQIPVQVISAPAEEMDIIQKESQAESEAASENKPIDMTASIEDKLEEESQAVMMGGYKPLSIDDIVELVKERLDHMPKDELETPMHLEQVLGDRQEEKLAEEKVETEAKAEEEEEKEEAKPAQSEEEDIVMPIYQRIVQPVNVEAGTPTESQEQDLSVEQSEASVAPNDIKEKTNRSYRSRSMLTPKLDPRKRLFLFKSDKNKSS